MQRCKVVFYVPGSIRFQVQSGEEDTAEDLIEKLRDGKAPAWLETQVLENLHLSEIEIEDVVISGPEPQDDEELDFDPEPKKRIKMFEGVLYSDDLDDLDW